MEGGRSRLRSCLNKSWRGVLQLEPLPGRYEGDFYMGKLHGHGIATWTSGSRWGPKSFCTCQPILSPASSNLFCLLVFQKRTHAQKMKGDTRKRLSPSRPPSALPLYSCRIRLFFPTGMKANGCTTRCTGTAPSRGATAMFIRERCPAQLHTF